LGLKRQVPKGDWRKQQDGELRNIYCSPTVKKVIKSRRMRWAGNIARKEQKGNIQKLWWGISRKEMTWKTQAYMEV
jgi:hypothetical protein